MVSVTEFDANLMTYYSLCTIKFLMGLNEIDCTLAKHTILKINASFNARRRTKSEDKVRDKSNCKFQLIANVRLRVGKQCEVWLAEKFSKVSRIRNYLGFENVFQLGARQLLPAGVVEGSRI